MSETSGRMPASRPYSPTPTAAGSPGPATLADILERVLDKGIIIAGDIRVNLLDIELLTIKLRLLVVSVDKAAEMGIDWWRHDPMLTVKERGLEEENQMLRERLAELEGGSDGDAQDDAEDDAEDEEQDEAGDEPERQREGARRDR